LQSQKCIYCSSERLVLQVATAKVLREKADAEELADQQAAERQEILGSRQCAQAVRETTEDRDWQKYADRAARFAFGAGGGRRVVELGGQLDHRRSLEKEVFQQVEPSSRNLSL
jgi:hypothetical protein